MRETVTTIRADAMLTPSGVVAPAELAMDAAGRISYAGVPRDAAARESGAASPRGSGQQEEHAGVLDLPGHVLMPGLVNGHTHSAMTVLRGVSDDAGFMPWLAAVQGLEQHLTHEDVAAGLELALVEMIETGTTAFADMYHWDAELIELVRASGMRALVAPATFAGDTVGFPGVSAADGAAVTELTTRLAAQYATDPQIRVAFGPHAPYTSPPEFLRDIAQRAVAQGIPIHTHVSESAAEVADITARYGTTPAAHLDRLGLCDAQLLAAHCVHLTPAELARFAEAGVAVSHNPVSNLKLGTGIAPLPELLAAGVRLALGTDSVASNNTLDLFEEIKLASILHRGVRQDAAAVRAADVLEIATRRGADAIGFPETGALESGRYADVIALDVTGTSATPFDPGALVSHLGFAARGSDVRHVFIGGRHIFADGTHLTIDAAAARDRAARAGRRLRERAGVTAQLSGQNGTEKAPSAHGDAPGHD